MNIPMQAPEPSLKLGVIGNCAYSALIDERARIVWCCLPRFDGDPVFNALLDPSENGSLWAFELEDFARSEQDYEPNTAILRTRLFDTQGQGIEITDFAPRFFSRGRMFRPLTLVRRVKVLSGLAAHARADAAALRLGPHQARGHPGQHPHPLRRARRRRCGSTATRRSELHAVRDLLRGRPADELHPGPGRDADLAASRTRRAASSRKRPAYWRTWTRALALPLEWQDAVIRAAITLKMSLFEDTGAIVAAMTTSIPEAPNSGRNWDYRYCWLRDAFFVVRALNSLSEVATMEEYLRWLNNVVVRSGGGHIQPLYGIGQEEQLPEAILDHLPGYRGHGPGARGQPGAGAFPARRVRQHHPGRVAGLPRPPPVPPRRQAPSSATWRRSASRPSASTTSPTPACGSCARARASTPRPRS